MGKGRLEAFSDGVIAIIITIMVLQLTVPKEPTFAALLPRNVGMIRQDVAGMLDILFRMIDAPPEDTPTVLVPCLLERL